MSLGKCWITKLSSPRKHSETYTHTPHSHALATVCTCGHVTKIRIQGDEGGETEHTGGVWWIVLPAGYVGSAFLGGCLIVASGSPFGALIACAVLVILLLFTFICWARSPWAVGLSILVLVLLVGSTIPFWLHVDPRAYGPRFATGFAGVLNCLFACYDIIDDLIKRTVDGSDSDKCSKHCSCISSSRCIGVCWFCYACTFFLLAVVICVVIVVPIDPTGKDIPQ